MAKTAIAPPKPPILSPKGRKPYDPIAEAKEYILNCVATNRQIDRVHVAELTGLPSADLDRLINGGISLKHGMPATLPAAPAVAKKRMSDEARANMSAAAQARVARNKEAKANASSS